MKVTLGEMIDRISIVNIKLFFQENIKRDSNDDHEIAQATRRTNDLNSQRNLLIEEMNLELNELAKGKQQKLFSANKSYGSNK